MRYPLGLVCVTCLVVALWPGPAPADDPPPAAATCPAPPRPVPGVAWWARPSDNGHYIGYYVGGGCLWRGSEPGPDQGTWGWDYCGWLHPHIKLLWCPCDRGYVPAYRTTGKVKVHSASSP